jgi:DNA ligase-1
MTLLSALVDTSQRVGASSSRRTKISELANLLRILQPEEIEIAVNYLSGELPQGRIGIGYAAVQAATADRLGADRVAATATLTLADVDRSLSALATQSGPGSAERRATILRDLLVQSTTDEQDFLVRLWLGDLRQGALGGVMLDAIAVAAEIPAAAVRRAAMYSAGVGAIARAALIEGAAALERFQLTLFGPVTPMLAQTADTVLEALQTLGGEAALEWKMDGARIQVHKRSDEVRIYTRNLNDVTTAVPEIVAAVRDFPDPTLVLDGEAIALDTAGRPLPFQVTMRRFGRKLNVEAMRGEIPLHGFFFDCLYGDGRSLVDRPLRERLTVLERIVPAAMRFPRIIISAAADAAALNADSSAANVALTDANAVSSAANAVSTEAAATAFYQQAMAAGQEGIMAKSLDAPYEAGNRGSSWLKIKRAHTLDLVVLAAEWGHGRRAGLLSNLQLGALDTETGGYIMLGKTFKGLTDAMLARQTEELLRREVRRDAGTVYVRPELVVEIAFSDLQASSRYPGGLALRLARVKRYRDDKRVEDADTMDAVRSIFRAQSGSP